MTLASAAKSAVRSLLGKAGLRIYRRPPRGIDLFDDIARDLPRLEVETIFDVGANVGQTAADYVAAYPAARIPENDRHVAL